MVRPIKTEVVSAPEVAVSCLDAALLGNALKVAADLAFAGADDSYSLL